MRGCLTALVFTTLLLAGCSQQQPTPAAPGSAVLVRGGGPDPDSLDPQKARGFEAQSILRDLCEGLTTLDAKAGVAPGVATSWSASGDGLTYTF
ncbi:MAG TPA: peptide ABC transporter substrate-binding protein, partial [Stellaceae bacterium]|nr:peptide ABC transporter substrate-binding protein [Stellaceae bacterium]